IIQNGLVPVFVDINLTDFSLNVDLLAQALSPKVKAIMLAHTLGNPFDVERIAAFAKENDLWMIEDCCDAVGSKFNGKMVGTFGDIATVSFYPAHHITMGEGGAVLTRSAKLKRIIESFRDWGRDCWCETGCDNTCGKRFEWQLGELPEGYDHKFTYSHLGYNLKVTDMQAALGLSQLDKIEQFNRARIENFNFLREQLAGLEKYLKLPTARPGAEPVWFGFPIIVKPNSPLSRTQLIVELDKRKIGTRLLFGGNLLKQPYMKSVKTKVVGPLENTDVAMENVFWIGVQPNLTSEMRQYVVEQFYNIFDYSNHTV
ncbi:MAG: lipopolysaccharide biosynthesis protein RfbH, partial [Candidatus Marinimicrobia bacterium CG_4_9_14_3_um_filter_48_9]